ncbi:signal transduction histidine kinase/CheY-like chemotaxis protein [Azospirillum fermentarium]|uniref:response regulator n=1 Tax=Azospirillum fermentarium TaxID=1233114 RepID=UPI00222734E2|nr:response regulator [Azospirillum fermentarium]MCW2244576.1 signal transduction histidine kinase/CheY-like chemotaxis protein [Azospirillum fermentarium]
MGGEMVEAADILLGLAAAALGLAAVLALPVRRFRLRVRALEAECDSLRVREAEARLLFDRAGDCLAVLSRDEAQAGAFFFDAVNAAMAAEAGVPATRLVHRRPADVLPPALARTVEENAARCLSMGVPLPCEETDEAGGTVRVWDTLLVPLPAVKGRPPRVLRASRDLTRQHRRLTEATQAKVQAELAARAKADFLASLGQEIRAPMNGIVGYATFLEDLAAGDDQRHYARQLRQSCRSLLTVIDDILDLTRIEAGRIDLRSDPFNLHEAMDHVLSLVGPAAREKRLSLRLDMGGAAGGPDGVPGFVVGDAARLRQILLNLLSNAVKFTPRGHVDLSVREQGRGPAGVTLAFTVSDSGVGIPPERCEQLLSGIPQVDRRSSLAYGGTGLGLAITRRLCEAMGGALFIRSAVGEGTSITVTVTLPAAGTPADLPGGGGGAAGTVSGLYRGRILLVEDVPMNRELVTRMLQGAGHTVETATDGAQAVEAVAKGGADLVLMDVLMPVMDGLEATRRIRAAGHTLPILALTATVRPEDVADCQEAGMNGHLPKPVDRDALLMAVQRWLRAGRADAAAPVSREEAAARHSASLHTLSGSAGGAGMVKQLDILLADLPPRLRSLNEVPPDWPRIARDARALASLAGCCPEALPGQAEFEAAAQALAVASTGGDTASAAAALERCRALAQKLLEAAAIQRTRLVPGGARLATGRE